ncbi:MAG: 5-bromo-4-chloroindolyl phosphate hydrolysis family protein [Sulfurovum sp.]|nr:5-bromo-4-chloroindolyl phosphate hydrolysis family protein [Sulfurovum sp.]
MANTTPYKPSKDRQTVPKGTLLYFFLVPLFIAVILALLQINIKAFIFNSMAFGLFFMTIQVSKKGFVQEDAYLKSTFAKAPKIYYKTLAGFLLGGSTFFTASIAGDKSFVSALFLGAIATLGYYLYYGFDPKEDKLDNLGDISADFVIATLREAKEKLVAIENHSKNIKDSVLSSKIKTAVAKAEYILKNIEEDPKDIRVARKFLMVYLDGVLNVTESYIALDEADITSETKEKLYTLFDDVEEKFSKELKKLKDNNLFDLDVHMDVLQQQIKN